MKKTITVFSKIFKRNIANKIAITIISFWLVISILEPFIANNRPIIAKSKDGWSIPIFDHKITNKEYTFQINPIVKYKYSDIDVSQSLLPPLSNGKNGNHILGTDKLGRDVLSGMIHGSGLSAFISFLSIGIALLIGFFIGLISGYFGNKGIKKNIFQIISLLVTIPLGLYYLINIFYQGLRLHNLLPLVVIVGIVILLDKVFKKSKNRVYGLPLDMTIQRLFELKESFPALFIILAIISIIAQPSYLTLSIIISFLLWFTFARHVRSEAIIIREEEYVKSAISSGISTYKLLKNHIAPNILPPLLVIVAFSFSSVILLESSLSFLGIGVPLEEVSWGKLLSESRGHPKSWWLALFPGMAIFLIVYAFNILGDALSSYQKPNN